MKTVTAKPKENPTQTIKTLGDMENYWTIDGSFNTELYKRISKLRSN